MSIVIKVDGVVGIRDVLSSHFRDSHEIHWSFCEIMLG